MQPGRVSRLTMADFEVHYQGLVAEADSLDLADDLARGLADRSPRIYRVTRDEVPSSLMPVGDLPGWQQLVAEDFARPVPVGGFVPGSGGYLSPAGAAGYAAYGPGRSGGNEIRVYPNGGGSNNRGWYNAPETLSVRTDVTGAAGVLNIHCKSGTIPGQTAVRGMGAAFWFPGPDSRWRKGPYFRAEFRARSVGFPSTGSNFGAVGLFIDDQGWPKGGELDWHENDLGVGERPRGYHHHADPAFTGSNWTQESFSAPAAAVMGDWHIYTTEWMPGRVRYLFDGQVVKDTTTKTPSVAMPFVIQCSSHGAEPLPAVEGDFQVDWVTLYRYAP